MEYKVIKGFFKLSERKTYNIGDAIELTEVEALEKSKQGLIEFKEVKAKKKKDD